jgi:hypothetical protein
MKCDWNGCEQEAVGFGNIHDNLTDKSYKTWHCERHYIMMDKVGLGFLNHVEVHEENTI